MFQGGGGIIKKFVDTIRDTILNISRMHTAKVYFIRKRVNLFE